jgi:hypothetical protein
VVLRACVCVWCAARIIVQTHSISALEQLTKGLNFTRVYCPHVIRLRLMAYGTLYPGLIAFFVNLLRGDPVLGFDDNSSAEWFHEFRAGAKNRIIRIVLDVAVDSAIHGKSFIQVAQYMYREFGIVMVGVDVFGMYVMNPHRRFRFELRHVPV